MRKPMRALALSLAALVAGVLPARAEQTTITVLSFVDPAKNGPRDKAFHQIIEKFEAANPDIKVQVVPNPFAEIGVKFLMEYATGQAQDVTFINAPNFGSLVKAGALADLQPLYINQMSQAQEADNFIRPAWNAALVDGKRYGVPVFVSSPVIYYRKDLFKAAGIDPASLKTWDEFTAALVKLTTNGANGAPIAGLAAPLSPDHTGTITAMGTMILGGQKQMWDPDTCQADYATPVGVNAINLHATWLNKDKVVPKDALVNNSDAAIETYEAGRAATAFAPFARFEQTRGEATFDKSAVGVMAWPNWTDTNPGPSWISGWWLGASSKSPHLAAAAKFIAFVTNPESDRTWALVGGQVPLHASVATDPAFNKPQFDALHVVLNEWKAASYVTPVKCNMSSYIPDLNAALQKVVFGKEDAMSALKEAEKSFEANQ